MGRRSVIAFVNASETHHDDARRYPPCQGHRQTGRGWNGSSARVLRRLLLLLLSDRRRWHCQHCSMVLSRIGSGCAGGSGGWWVIGWPSSFQTACFNEEAGLADLRRFHGVLARSSCCIGRTCRTGWRCVVSWQIGVCKSSSFHTLCFTPLNFVGISI